MILVLMGKTASGKDSIAKELYRNYQLRKILAYTTRPPRQGEFDGVDYHFISNSEFQKGIKYDAFVEWKSYQTVDGEWFYGTARKDILKDGVLILTPQGVKDLYQNSNQIIRTVYIKASEDVLMQRLVARGDNPAEANRRLKHDNLDFDDSIIKQFVDYEILNEGRQIPEIAEEIANYWKREKNEVHRDGFIKY